jgi:hypothetical protein
MGPGMTGLSSLGENRVFTGTGGDDQSSCFSNVSAAFNKDADDDVNNMLNEASAFNCHQIQAANFDSQVSNNNLGANFTGVDNKLEESSLIYNAQDYAARKL